jgi:N-acetyltransferase 10
MKKKIDDRIKILIQNCVRLNHRSLVLIVGDRGIYQVANLHYMLTKARVKA